MLAAAHPNNKKYWSIILTMIMDSSVILIVENLEKENGI